MLYVFDPVGLWVVGKDVVRQAPEGKEITVQVLGGWNKASWTAYQESALGVFQGPGENEIYGHVAPNEHVSWIV